MTATSLTTDVLVVGAGPAGLATAIGVARNGARVLLVERHPSTTIFPRATGVNIRTMEVLRSWGLHRRIRAGEIPVRPLTSVSPTVREADPVGISLGYPPDPRACLAVSPVLPACCPQDHVEPVLLEHLRSLGAEVRFGVELTSLVDDGAGVRADLLDRSTGGVTRVRARFAVGADGPRSTVRRAVGIGVERLGSLGPYATIVFRADLDPVIGARRYPLYFLGDAPLPTAVLPLGGGRWGFLRPGELPADGPLDALAPLIRDALGVPTLEVRVLARLPFEMAAELADRFRSGNVFLVGDSAHRMTPRGAVGMNTAIQGGHNLGWKLAWVARGWAGPALLDSYEAERRPPAEDNTRRSVRLDAPLPSDRLAADLGVRYVSDVVDDTVAAGPAAPGARAPHVWINHHGRRRSTLDVFDRRLTLLVGPGDPAWRQAAVRCPVPVQVLGLDRHPAGTAARLRDAYGLGAGAAVLVRPDGHVAWRCDAAAQPEPALRAGIRTALGLAAPASARPDRAA